MCKIYRLTLLCAMAVSLLKAAPVWSSPISTGTHAPAQNNTMSDSNQDSSDWAWLSEEWTGDNRPFAAIQTELDNKAAHGLLTTDDIDQYESNYHRDKTNPLLGFRWVYSYFIADRSHPRVKVTGAASGYVFENSKDPQAYDYIRLRYLEIVSDYAHNTEFIALGKTAS